MTPEERAERCIAVALRPDGGIDWRNADTWVAHIDLKQRIANAIREAVEAERRNPIVIVGRATILPDRGERGRDYLGESPAENEPGVAELMQTQGDRGQSWPADGNCFSNVGTSNCDCRSYANRAKVQQRCQHDFRCQKCGMCHGGNTAAAPLAPLRIFLPDHLE